MEIALLRFGCVHKSIHGDGGDVLARVVQTCEEMLRDRGCARVSRAERPLDAIEAGTPPVVTGRGGNADVDVYVHVEDKVGVKFARQVLEQRDEEEVHVVVVSIDGATPFTRKECEGKRIQFMLARDLCVNKMRHCLVPKHEVMDGYEGDVSLLPKISDADPVVQYYNFPLGTVLRVWRVFGGSEPIPYLRVVTPMSG